MTSIKKLTCHSPIDAQRAELTAT